MCKGKVFPEVEIDVTASYAGQRRAGYYAYKLKNVMITRYKVGGGTYHSFRPVEEISLNVEEIKVTYTESGPAGGPAGNVEYSWKVEEGQG